MHYGLFPLSSVWRVAKLRQWPVRVQTVKACGALKQSARSPHTLQTLVDLENEETRLKFKQGNKRYNGKKGNMFLGVCRLCVTLERCLRDSCVACHRGGTNAHAHKQTDAIRCDGSTPTGLRPHGRVFRCLWGSDDHARPPQALLVVDLYIWQHRGHKTVHTCNTGVSL